MAKINDQIAPHKSEAIFKDLFRNSPDPCWIIDEKNLFTLCNQAAAEMLGYESIEALQSTHPSKLSPEVQPDGHESFEKANTMMSIAHNKGLHRFEWMHQRKNGDCFPVEVTLAKIELDGKPKLYCVWRNITERKRAEEALRQSEAQFRSIIDASPVPYALNDEEQNITYLNPSFINTFGYELQDIPTLEAWWPKAYPDETYRQWVATTWQKHLDKARHEGLPFETLELNVRCKDGSTRTVIAGASSLDEAYKGNHLVTLYDITERKQIEEKLLSNEERFDLAMQGANDGLWDWDLETDEVYYSPRWFSMLGYDADALPPTIDTWAKLVHPDDKDWVLQRVSGYLENRIDSFEVEMRMCHRDGHDVIVLSRASKVLRNSDQKPVRLVGTHVDITERKQQQMLLEASREKFSTLFDSSSDGIFILNMQGGFIDINKTAHERLGYSKDEMLKMKLTELDPPEFAARVPERLEQIFSQGMATFETAHYRKDGSIMPVEINARIIELDGEKVFFSVIRDISDRKMLEEQLRHSQKMEAIGTLVGGIAHDFNNMLAAIQGNIYMAKKQMQGHPVATDRLTNIEQLSKRAADMVQQLLTFARKDIVELSLFSLNVFMEEGYKLIHASVPENIDHQTILCKESLRIYGDTTQLQQAMMNLINNAVDAVADVPHPVIRCTLTPFESDEAFRQRHPALQEERFACITVKDNGHGIPDEQLDKIFEPFFTTKDVGKGSGLGLAMLYGAIETHGGAIEVESEVDSGTSFHVYFPLSDHQTEIEIEEQVPGAEVHGETILLVDDEQDVRTTTSEVLTSMGYHVLEAVDGADALDLFKSEMGRIDIIITDVVMPRMSGTDLLNNVRLLDKKLPVILATGYDKSHLQGDNIQDKSSQLINKPFDFDDLSRSIQLMLKPE